MENAVEIIKNSVDFKNPVKFSSSSSFSGETTRKSMFFGQNHPMENSVKFTENSVISMDLKD